MRLQVFADLHLGAPLPEWGEAAATRRGVLRRALTALVDAALGGIDAVLVAGDLFDRPDPDPDLVAFATGELERLTDAGIPVILVPGLYDNIFHADSVYRTRSFPEGVTVVREATPTVYALDTQHGPLHVHSFAWVPGATPESPWSSLRSDGGEGVHLGLLHAHLDAPAHDVVPGLQAESEDFMESDLDMIVLGRGHDFSERETRGGPRLLVPGSPVGLSADETGERGFVRIAVDETGVRCERVPLPTPPVVEETFHVDPDTSIEILGARIAGRIEGCGFARVVLEGKVESCLDHEALRAALPPAASIEILDRTETVPPEGASSFSEIFLSGIHARLAHASAPEERDVLRRALRHAHAALDASEADHAA